MSSEDIGIDNGADNMTCREFALGDFEVTFNFKKLKSPIDILEKLQVLHENEKLTNEEKNKIVQKIINDYME